MRNLITRAAAAVAMVGLLGLGACASPARPEAMTLLPSTIEAATPGDFGYQSIRVASVQGGGDTNPMWLSNVSNIEFKKALEGSLAATGYFRADGPYSLTATMIDLQRPMAGLDLSVTSRVRYSVVDQANAVVFDDTVAATGTAKFGDSLLAVERLRLANEASVRENIKAFVERFRAHTEN